MPCTYANYENRCQVLGDPEAVALRELSLSLVILEADQRLSVLPENEGLDSEGAKATSFSVDQIFGITLSGVGTTDSVHQSGHCFRGI